MNWDAATQKKYDAMIAKIPLFHREITKQIVPLKAEENAKDRGSSVIEEGDVISAFLTEVPKAFYSLMIRLMDDVGFQHKPYSEK
ncbi:MAG: hypothetical protein NT079_04145 [Candidatus Omnitrophica bacterium]|nr:hypothetical protein [Candidatus Omnitrophota bacterium]